ncbi:hypothetical protein [Kibdelosporangium aridum]|uniref:hypothetical protein n=1 Tax=Kibdelosporangium aridum TaxID=2030 RepID=UPI0021ADFBA3|nr:hypothetical protein [Kibdelosporangium aridum]
MWTSQRRSTKGLGFRLDADFPVPGKKFRVVRLTPPGSECSIIFGDGVTTTEPGSTRGLHLIVDDIVATRDELARVGLDIFPVFHDADGNGWVLQEVKVRAPGR